MFEGSFIACAIVKHFSALALELALFDVTFNVTPFMNDEIVPGVRRQRRQVVETFLSLWGQVMKRDPLRIGCGGLLRQDKGS